MSIKSEYGGSRSRVCLEGWIGRRRNYKCRICGNKFQHDGNQLPAGARICSGCLEKPEAMERFHKAFEERDRKQSSNLNSYIYDNKNFK